MNNRTRAALKTPVIGRVVTLNNYMITHGKRAYKIVQHNYIDTILKEGALLFKHCYRHLQGLDYRKRIIESAYDIQAQAYFIASLGGWSPKVAAVIDESCEEVISQVSKMSQNQQAEK